MVPLINRMEQRRAVIRKRSLYIVDDALASELRRYADAANRLDPHHGGCRNVLVERNTNKPESVTNDVSTFIHATRANSCYS